MPFLQRFLIVKAPLSLPAKVATPMRPLLDLARTGNEVDLERSLMAEESLERQTDREYWQPLRRELEAFRHTAGSQETVVNAPE